MEGFKRGFYTTSKKLKRKPESRLGQSSFPQPQTFSQSQQPGEEQQQVQKTAHTITPISQEKPRKQKKSALHQEVSEFNPSSRMNMEQLIKVVSDLKEELRKLKKDNDKLMENLNKQEEIESSLMSQERDLNAFLSTSQDQSNQSQSQQQKQKEIGNRIEKIEESQQKLQLQMEIREYKSELMQTEQEDIRNPQKIEVNKDQKKSFVAEAYDIYEGNVRNSIRKAELLDPRKEKKKSRRSKIKPNILQSKWRNFQNQERRDKTSTRKKRKVNLEKTEFPISLKLEVPNIFIQQQGS